MKDQFVCFHQLPPVQIEPAPVILQGFDGIGHPVSVIVEPDLILHDKGAWRPGTAIVDSVALINDDPVVGPCPSAVCATGKPDRVAIPLALFDIVVADRGVVHVQPVAAVDAVTAGRLDHTRIIDMKSCFMKGEYRLSPDAIDEFAVKNLVRADGGGWG